jgi:hypothetical protein
VKLLRFRIAWATLLIALAALNLDAIREWSHITSKTLNLASTAPAGLDRARFLTTLVRADLLAMGALPMGNILAVSLMIHRRRRDSPFLLGFEAFGATALTVYVAVASYITFGQFWSCLNVVLGPHRNIFGPTPTAAVHFIFAVMFVLPQLAFALIGGLIFRRFRAVGRPDQVPR